MNGKINKKNILTIATLVVTVLAHIAFVVAVVLAKDYFAIYPSLFGCAIAIVVCLLIITDIILLFGINLNDLGLKITSLVLASLIMICGIAAAIGVNFVNDLVDDVLYSGEDRYQTIEGVFLTNDEKLKTFDLLKEKEVVRVGIVTESTEGISSIAQSILDEKKIQYVVQEYDTMIDCLSALSNKACDVAVVTSAYSSILTADEENDYEHLLDSIIVIDTFNKDVKIETKVSKKDISKEPFNVLLIGWSRTELGSKVGLADAIILASINPQTYTVSLMSIPRDSYFPISCHNGREMKINSGRSTSLDCFVTDIEALIGEEIDFYAEMDYEGIITLVQAMDGIWINNPVDFELDGIFVEAGHYKANGWMVLQFCRERHHMPNGDFDRQQHQKEVIIEICKELIESKNINLVIKCIQESSDWLTTNLTMNQISTIFNLILNTQNWTGLDTFDLVDFQQTRMTGYASWTYSDSWKFPIWIYKLYKGSIEDSVNLMDKILGKKVDISDQVYNMQFSVNNPYQRALFYRENYDEKEVHEVLPPMVGKLTKMTYSEACEWAKENNVKLKVNYIDYGDPDFDESKVGQVISQNPAYGRRLSEVDEVEITVMGSVDESKIVPDLIGKNYSKAIKWCEKSDFKLKVEFVDSDEEGWTIIEQSIPAYTNTDSLDTSTLKIKVSNPVEINKTIGLTKDKLNEWAKTNMLKEIKIVYVEKKENDGYNESDYGKVVNYSPKDKDLDPNSEITFSILAKSYKVTVTSKDETMGTVSPKDPVSLLTGKEVEIKAVAKEGYKFVKWSDGNTEATRKITIEDKDITLSAEFKAKEKYVITVTATEGGTVTGGGEFFEDSKQTIKATPNEGYKFVKWSDGDTNATREITVEKAIEYKAEFKAKEKYTITVSAGSNGSVSGGGSDIYEGTTITITATPNANYKFVKWSDGNTEATRTITVTGNATYTAEFKEKEQFTVSVTCGEGGTVSGGGTAYEGESITITATANSGYHFVSWSDGGSASHSVTTGGTYTATFEKDADPS